MKAKLLVLATLAILGCENPIDHFTEGPDRGSHTVIRDCPVDSTKSGVKIDTLCQVKYQE